MGDDQRLVGSEPPVDAPSRTSQVVALERSRFPRPHSPEGDPDAQVGLCRGMQPTPPSSLRSHLQARTRFIDDQVLTAIEGGVSQIVILGAGYDDRALRFRTPGIRFFELDHPGTQHDKRRQLRAMGADLAQATLAEVDFRLDDVAAVLAFCGHDAAVPSLFICEGLLVYLDRLTTTDLLAGLRARSSGVGWLVATVAVHRPELDSERVVAWCNDGRPDGVTEPWRTILPAERQFELLAESGWSVVGVIDDAALGTGAEPDRSLLVWATPRPATD